MSYLSLSLKMRVSAETSSVGMMTFFLQPVANGSTMQTTSTNNIVLTGRLFMSGGFYLSNYYWGLLFLLFSRRHSEFRKVR